MNNKEIAAEGSTNVSTKERSNDGSQKKVSRHELIEALNQDLSREYQAIIAYVVYSQVLKGASI